MSTPEQPSVDWLDPARESCLIDGVRYRREGSSAVEKLLAEWEAIEWRGVDPYGAATRGCADQLRVAIEADQHPARR